MKYYAHSDNDRDEKHPLSEHLRETAEFTESFACQKTYKPAFRMAGLLHDLGKYQPEFQRYLEASGKRGSVPHAAWGAGYARQCRLIEASLAINGHHKGLPDNSAWKGDTEPFRREDVDGFHEVVEAFLADVDVEESSIRGIGSLSFNNTFEREAFIRYLFSSLTDSDWLSTEKHFNKTAFDTRARLTLQVDEMISKLDLEFSKKPKNG